jgi:glycosyltransferase involved in cell wall biosynthesis
LLARRPNAHVLIVGGDDVSYGAKLANGMTYRRLMLEQLGPLRELERVHFMGQVPYETYLSVLQVSAVHVYLTYPFVLSWSFVEAMAAGCALVASNTAPVLEYAEHGKHARLVDFFSTSQIVDAVADLLENRKAARDLRRNARRRVVETLDLDRVILPAWREFLADAVASRRDPTADLSP